MLALGIVGFSGSGKTTLLTRVIEVLSARGVRIGAVKHAHHGFEPDVKGKDSDRMRRAGAVQTLVFSAERWALFTEQNPPLAPTIPALVAVLEPCRIDLVLIEGLRSADYPKIEVHRPSLGHPLLAQTDPRVIAVATDDLDALRGLGLGCPLLDLNDPQKVADFVGSLGQKGGFKMSENTTSQASSKAQFEELRGKFEERLGQLSKQIDELSERFQKGATDAKASVEADLHKLKAEHQAEYEQFQKLQKVAEESWGMLQKRLDTIATEMRSVVGQAVGQAASALGIAHSEQTDATAQSQAAEPAAPAAPSAPDAGTDSAPSAKQ